MKLVVLQRRIKRLGCIWKDHTYYPLAEMAPAKQDLAKYNPGGVYSTDNYVKKREWRLVIRETIEQVIS